MVEFVGLRAKLYAYRQRKWKTDGNGNELNELSDAHGDVKKCKGVGKAAVRHELLFEHYRSCLLHREKKSVTMTAIRSKLHQVSTVRQHKVALASFDDKRYMLDDVSSLPYGHVHTL